MHLLSTWPAVAQFFIVVLLAATMGRPAVAVREHDHQGPAPQSAGHAEDPCEHAPVPRGKAEGLERCDPAGSSNGVARGDFNGDGFADLAIGVPGENLGTIEDAGAVTVIYGSANGLSASAVVPAQFWHQDVPGIQEAAEARDRFGSALAAGDFNGDGFSDLAIAAPGDNVVHWLFGSATGLTATNNQIVRGTNFVDASGNPLTLLAGLSWGDFDGDTFGDLAIEARAPFGVSFQSAVVVLYGSSQSFGLRFLSSRPPFFFPNSASGNTDVGNVGSTRAVLVAGRFNADARDDLAVGLPFADVTVGGVTIFDAGGVFILPGSANGVTTIGISSLIQESGGEVSESADAFGSTLAAGDFNGDALADLAVGAPFEDRGTVGNEGMVMVFLGASVFHSTWTQSVLGHPRHAGDSFGGALAAGDFNGDGFRDLAIGTPGDQLSSSTDNAGSVTVLYGGAGGLATGNGPGVQFFTESIISGTASSAAGDRFGASLTAWNFGRTPQADLAIGVPDKDILVSTGGGLRGIQTQLQADAGLVRVVYGTAAGLSTTGAQVFTQNSSGIPDSVEAGDRFGTTVY